MWRASVVGQRCTHDLAESLSKAVGRKRDPVSCRRREPGDLCAERDADHELRPPRGNPYLLFATVNAHGTRLESTDDVASERDWEGSSVDPVRTPLVPRRALDDQIRIGSGDLEVLAA